MLPDQVQNSFNFNSYAYRRLIEDIKVNNTSTVAPGATDRLLISGVGEARSERHSVAWKTRDLAYRSTGCRSLGARK